MVGLYFHIPFCRKKCPYCHFFVLRDQAAHRTLFFAALEREWHSRLPQLQGQRIASIYFGGGTPSLCAPQGIAQILQWILASGIQRCDACEITLEANPEDVTPSLMRELGAIGINRISLGVQSLDTSQLHVLGRNHSPSQAMRAVESTHAAGIHNISIDLMNELPHQTVHSWEQTLRSVRPLPITHLSLYNLTLESPSSFARQRVRLAPLLPSPEDSLRMLELACSILPSYGLERYEISAFAKPGFSSRHNTGYWIGRPFLGFGPSAFSYWEGARFRNVANLAQYAQALQEGRSAVDFSERLEYPRNCCEQLAISLRLIEGVDLRLLPPLPSNTLRSVELLKKQGWLTQTGSQLLLTPQGLLFYDSVAQELVVDDPEPQEA